MDRERETERQITSKLD